MYFYLKYYGRLTQSSSHGAYILVEKLQLHCIGLEPNPGLLSSIWGFNTEFAHQICM